ncbi:MAG: universal stress protein, partial [Pirellulales bacterium]|nr:universal stress protein [Pirellulales bacterium]
KGHSAIDRILLGSTSDFVATHADCSVLVVRPTGLLDDPERPFYVALAYDSSPPSQTAVEQFREFSWGPKTTVYAISVVSTVSGLLNPMVVDTTVDQELASQALQEVLPRIQAVAPETEGRVIESGHVGDGITQFVKDHQFDLVVIGDSGRSALGRLVLGSVPQYVMRHADCSIWIARERTGST